MIDLIRQTRSSYEFHRDKAYIFQLNGPIYKRIRCSSSTSHSGQTWKFMSFIWKPWWYASRFHFFIKSYYDPAGVIISNNHNLASTLQGENSWNLERRGKHRYKHTGLNIPLLFTRLNQQMLLYQDVVYVKQKVLYLAFYRWHPLINLVNGEKHLTKGNDRPASSGVNYTDGKASAGKWDLQKPLKRTLHRHFLRF